MGAQGVGWPKTSGLCEEGLEVLFAEEIGRPSPAVASKEPCGWDLMTWVVRVAQAGKPDDHA